MWAPKLGSTKIIFEDRCTLIIREPFIWEKRTRQQEIVKSDVKCETTVDKKYSKDLEQDKLEIAPRFTISNAKEKKSRCHKRKTDFPRLRVQRN